MFGMIEDRSDWRVCRVLVDMLLIPSTVAAISLRGRTSSSLATMSDSTSGSGEGLDSMAAAEVSSCFRGDGFCSYGPS